MTDPLDTWVDLNKFIMKAGEQDCQKLLKIELKQRKRKIFALRIHSRLNKIRAARERKEILASIK